MSKFSNIVAKSCMKNVKHYHIYTFHGFLSEQDYIHSILFRFICIEFRKDFLETFSYKRRQKNLNDSINRKMVSQNIVFVLQKFLSCPLIKKLPKV